MKKLISLVSSLAVVAVLASCGGGDDGPPPTSAKYAGTWIACVSTGTASSRKETLVLTELTAESVGFNYSETNYATASCGGTAGSTSTKTGTVAFSGTKTIGPDTVDKGIVTQVGSAPEKQVFVVKGTAPEMLFMGKTADDSGTLDTEGYPTTLDPNGLAKSATTAPLPGVAGTELSMYAGTWIGCFNDATSSERETIVFTQQGADTFAVAATTAHYGALGCTGPVTRTDAENGMVTFTGTKTIGSDTVQKFIFTATGSAPSKNVALLKGTNPVTLTFGRQTSDGGTVDADGYPNVLESSSSGSYTKQ